MNDQIRAEIAKIEAERNAYIERVQAEFQRVVLAYNAGIDALKRLIPTPDPSPLHEEGENAEG